MSDPITKATARRDFLARLVLINEAFSPVFEWADKQLAIAQAASDPVAAARAISQRRAA